MGTDGITTGKFAQILDDEITIIKRKVKNQTYNVSPYREKLIVKNRFSVPRMISIPTNRDRLVFSALTQFLTDSFRSDLYHSTIHSNILDIKRNIKNSKYDCFIKLDIQNFYPSIDHEVLLEKVSVEIDDSTAISLISKAIRKYTIPDGRIERSKFRELEIGVPQGLSISGILSTIYMADMDRKYLSMEDISYYRFVDDMLILCKKENLDAVRTKIVEDMRDLKLEVHPFEENSNKSSFGIVGENKFQFLGYEFYNDVVTVRESSLDNFYDSLIELFQKVEDAKELYYSLNHKITGCIYDGKRYGWMSFFALIDDIKLLYRLDAFIKNSFIKYNFPYREDKVKKFVKTYFELKNIEKSDYIPKYSSRKKFKDSKTGGTHFREMIKELRKDMEFYY